MNSGFLRTLLDDASRPFYGSGRFAYHYSRGKLSSDCIFREVLKRGIFPAEARFLDLGCGQGSLFAWLLAARKLYEQGQWPGDWAAPPKPLSLRGVELMQKDVERAARAFGSESPRRQHPPGRYVRDGFRPRRCRHHPRCLALYRPRPAKGCACAHSGRAAAGRAVSDPRRRCRSRPAVPVCATGWITP